MRVRSPGVRQPADPRPAATRLSAAAAPEALPQARTNRRPSAGRGAGQNRWAPSRPERPRPPVWLLDPPGVLDRQGGGIPLPPAISRPLTDQMGASPPSNPPVECTLGWPGPVPSAAWPGRRAQARTSVPAGSGPGRRGMATASSIRTGWQAGAPPPPRGAWGQAAPDTASVMVGPGGRGGTCALSSPGGNSRGSGARCAYRPQTRGGRLCWTHCLWPLRT